MIVNIKIYIPYHKTEEPYPKRNGSIECLVSSQQQQQQQQGRKKGNN